MKRLFSFIAGLALLATLAGCPSTVPKATFNDQAAIGERSVQLVQTTSTALLRAKKITLEQDQLIQKQVELAHDGIVLAKRLQANDPTGAAAQLTAALDQIGALKKQTGVQP